MGYFSNGSEGMDYEADYCDRCVHQNGPDGDSVCAVWAAHKFHNYKECNNKESILHMLIPRSEEGLGNGQCLMFVEDKRAKIDDQEELEIAADCLKRNDKPEALLHLGRALGGDWEKALS